MANMKLLNCSGKTLQHIDFKDNGGYAFELHAYMYPWRDVFQKFDGEKKLVSVDISGEVKAGNHWGV